MFTVEDVTKNQSERIEEEGLDLHQLLVRGNYYLGQIDAEGFGDEYKHMEMNGESIYKRYSDWISFSHVAEAGYLYQNGLDSRLERHNGKYNEDTDGTITFPNEAIAVVWLDEILGQISDGAWENSEIDWKKYHSMKVEIDESLSDVTVDKQIEPLNFKEELKQYSGLVARMLFMARCSGAEEGYNEVQLTADLANLDNWEVEV